MYAALTTHVTAAAHVSDHVTAVMTSSAVAMATTGTCQMTSL